jgi:hypothetical protein
MDYGLAVQVLLHQAGHAHQDESVQCHGAEQDVSAETSHDEHDEQDVEQDAEWRRRDEEGTSLLRLQLKSNH